MLDRVAAARARAWRSRRSPVREDHDELRERVRDARLAVPVGYDHDGAVGNLYGFGASARCSRSPTRRAGRRDARRLARRGGADDARAGAGGGAAAAVSRDATRSPSRRRGRPARRRGAPGAARLDRARAGRHGPDAAGAARAARARTPTGCADPRRSRCARGRCRGPTACCSATSGSTRTSRARRSRSSSLDRLLHGGFAPRGLPEDALALATLETGVPVSGRSTRTRTGALDARAPARRPARARRRPRHGRGAVRAAAARPRAGRATTRAAARRGAGAGRRRPLRRGGAVDGGRRDAYH